MLVGCCAGLAVLTKWLPGCLVFASWVVHLCFDSRARRRRDTVPLLSSIAVAIAMPWQLYVAAAYPLESTYESAYSARQLFEALEGHSGVGCTILLGCRDSTAITHGR